MNTFYLRGGAGDIIYALPAIQAAGGGHLICGIPKLQFHALKPLIDLQPGIQLFSHNEEGIPAGFIDMDAFLNHKDVHRQHLCKTFGEILNVTPSYKNGWLNVPLRTVSNSYAVLNVTQRYRDKIFSWHDEVYFLRQNTEFPIKFIGTKMEYNAFRNKYGWTGLTYHQTETFLDAAKLIACAKYFTGTQSTCLAIAEGLFRTYRYERSPFFDNVRMSIPRETVLNKGTHKTHFALSKMQEVWRNFRSK